MNDRKHKTLPLPADRGQFLDWATSEDDGCLSVAGLAARSGLMEEPVSVEQENPRVTVESPDQEHPCEDSTGRDDGQVD